MAIKKEDLKDVFTYHPPENDDQLNAYAKIREAGHTLALVIILNTPFCADQQAAIKKVREAVMTANSAVALKGKV